MWGNRVFRRFLVYYTAFLLFPTMMVLIVYSRTIGTLEAGEIRSTLFHLEKVSGALDTELSAVERVARRMSVDPVLLSFAVSQPETDSPSFNLRVQELLDRISLYYDTSPFVQMIVVYFDRPGVIVRGDSTTHVVSRDRRHFTYGSPNYTDWDAARLAGPASCGYTYDYLPPGSPTPSLTFAYYVPEYAGPNALLSIYLQIDPWRVTDLLTAVSESAQTYLHFDGSDRFIPADAPALSAAPIEETAPGQAGYQRMRLEGRRVLLLYAHSATYPWCLGSQMPERTVVARSRILRLLMIAVALLTVGCGLPCAVWLALKNAGPIAAIARTLAGDGMDGHHSPSEQYALIYRSARRLVTENTEMERQMRRQLPMLRWAYVERLLQGRSADRRNLSDRAALLGLVLPGPGYCVALVRIASEEEHGVLRRGGGYTHILQAKAAATQQLRTDLGAVAHMHDQSERDLLLVLSLPAEPDEQMHAQIESAFRRVFDLVRNHNCHACFAVGERVESLSDIWRSYAHCAEFGGVMSRGGQFAVNWHEERPPAAYSYFYPIEVEERLINNVLAGNWDEVQNIVESWRQDCARHASESPNVLEVAVHHLRGTLMRIIDKLRLLDQDALREISERSLHVTTTPTFDDACQKLKDVLWMVCRAIDGQKKSHNRRLVERVQQYVQEHVDDLCLNRYMVAREFDMSEKYLSALFKEQSGVSFSAYLEKTRMERATSLLSETQLTIECVARDTGYGSAMAFRRAFKRVIGMSPSVFKKAGPRRQAETTGDSVRTPS